MAMEINKPVTRKLPVYVRNKQLTARIAPEGIYIKRGSQRWSKAYFLPWMAAHDVGAKMLAAKIMKERKEKRKAKRLGA